MKNTRNKIINEKNPSFDEVINGLINQALYNSNFAIPGKVDSYNATKKTVEVTPLIKKIYLDGEVITLPRIPSVPVAFPQASNFSLTFPLKKGDEVLLIFSQRSLEQWKQAGGIVEPKDLRKNNITDAIAIPGLTYPGGGDSGDANNLILRFYNAKITMKSDSTILLENASGSIELVGTTGQAKINGTNLTVDI